MIHRITSLIALLAFASSAIAQETTSSADLRPVWEQGQSSKYRVVSERITAAQVVGVGKPRGSRLKVLAEITWTVTQAQPDGGGVCKMTVDQMQMLMTDGSGKQYKVTAEGAPPENLEKAQALVRAMIGKEMTVNVAADGSIDSVSGWQAIKTAAGEAAQNMNESDFRETATELALLVGGSATTAPGSSWTRRFDWSHEMGDLRMDSTYRLEGVEEIAQIPIAMIQGQSKLDLTIDQSKFNGQDVNVRITEGQETAQIMYDLSRHEVVGRNTDRTLGLEMKLNVQGRQFTQVIKQRLVTSTLRIAEN